jgi:phenylalanyl-tRNA synthetase beta chain
VPALGGAVFTDVKSGPSPPWLKARVAAAGMRPISNVVDITNYVMLCVGEPTHAFDLDKVTGREIIVRRAGDGEGVITLDGQGRTLDADVLVIADTEKPSAVAGLMGSQWSEVSEATTTVLMECANFDGPNIQSSSTRLELRTEGSTRWEKGLDPHLVPRALALASQLMVELTGARLVPGTVDLHGQLPEPAVVPLRRERLELLIGVPYEQAQIDRALTRLGYESADGGWRVPTWRANDTFREVDLIEEVARIDGVWKVPTVMPPHADAIGKRDPDVRLAQPRDRGAARRRPVGGGHRRLHGRDAGRPAAASARPSSPRRGAGGEPDGCRPGAASHRAVPGAAGLGPPQPGRRPRPGCPVRGGPCGAAGAGSRSCRTSRCGCPV